VDKAYSKEYFDLERNHWWFKVRGSILLQRLRQSVNGRDLRILNVGVATGRTTELLEELGDVTSIEFDKDCLEFTQQALGIEIIHGSIADLPFSDGAFDVVTAFDVLEHVEAHEQGASELKRVCRPGGIVCVSVPACMSMWSRHDEVNHHFRRYSRQDLVDLFKDEIGNIEHLTFFNSFLFFPIWIFRRLSRKARRGISSTGGESDFSIGGTGLLSNMIAGSIFALEKPLIRAGIRLPIGVSLLLTWRKQKQS